MDPLSALGVAAAAIQLFEFTRTIFKEYRGLQNSGGESGHWTQYTIDKTTRELRSLALRLKCPEKRADHNDVAVAGHELVRIPLK
jgi:hypothetical protein